MTVINEGLYSRVTSVDAKRLLRGIGGAFVGLTSLTNKILNTFVLHSKKAEKIGILVIKKLNDIENRSLESGTGY